MNNLIIRRIVVLSLFCICAAAGEGANLIRNNGFEKPRVADGGFLLFAQGSSFTNWFVIRAGAFGNVGIFSTDYSESGFTFPAQSGVQWLDLTGNTNTVCGVEQRVATTPGQEYRLRFFVGNIYDPTGSLGTTSTVNVLVNGSQVMSATNTGGIGSTTLNWRAFSVTFTALNGMTTITFMNGDPSGDSCNGLDSVTLAPVAAD